MKTAMQELVLKLPNEFIFDNPSIILEALEKEKEQMLSEWKKGFEDAKYIYEQTYNQNK